MDATTVRGVLTEEMGKYAGKDKNMYSYLTENKSRALYTIVNMTTFPGRRIIGTTLAVRLEDDKIIIELDHSRSPLIRALEKRGVPKEQMVLAYVENTVLP
jgi:hypothetical protein